ncbi:nucleotidyltransferase family protein [Herbiconiux sp. A18JL235]|uniref:Nucleotidyltransferase family protein n=1 Tax=Herbiconiux sp. A18JL235 TaxID=3152363 RepID=A0AB39BJV3_9MICO
MELAAALASHVAARASIELLVIKGPVLAAQGLRAPRIYADIDVWVPQSDAERFVDLLGDQGWHERGPSWFLERVGSHSFTLIHDAWPCDIDIHVRFPGMLAPDDVVFGELWRTRSEVSLAGREVQATGRAASVVILALHSLRQIWDVARKSELDQLIDRVKDDAELIEAVRRLASIVGANETLAPLFEALGVKTLTGFAPDPRALRAWDGRRAHHSRTGQWLEFLTKTPRRARAHEFWMIIWPPRELYLQDHPDAPDDRAHLFIARLRRLLKGANGVMRIAIQKVRTRGSAS